MGVGRVISANSTYIQICMQQAQSFSLKQKLICLKSISALTLKLLSHQKNMVSHLKNVVTTIYFAACQIFSC